MAFGRLEPINSQKADEILPKILPPIVFEKDGQLWNQKVSATPATRLDVQRLANVSVFFFVCFIAQICTVNVNEGLYQTEKG